MNFCKVIIQISLLLATSVCVNAQDTGFVYQDTALMYKDSVAVAEKAYESAKDSLSQNNNTAAESDNKYATDTLLINNQLTLNGDSINAIKNSKQFLYAKSLDSLLYQEQQIRAKEVARQRNSFSWLDRFFSSSITKYFFWILAGVFIFFILYKLLFTEGFFQRSYAKSTVTELPEESEELSATKDYEKLITQAVNAGDYRIAVRYYYLQTLQKLTAKGAIQFARDKTNYEYLKELSGRSYKNEFASLTRNYEYVWYGEFEIDEIIFNALQTKFKQFNNGV
jgi:hypothetical protein